MFISVLEAWKSKLKAVADLMLALVRTYFCLVEVYVLPVSSRDGKQREEASSLVTLIRALIPLMSILLLSNFNYLPRT